MNESMEGGSCPHSTFTRLKDQYQQLLIRNNESQKTMKYKFQSDEIIKQNSMTSKNSH